MVTLNLLMYENGLYWTGLGEVIRPGYRAGCNGNVDVRPGCGEKAGALTET